MHRCKTVLKRPGHDLVDVLQDQLICSSHVTHMNEWMSHIWMSGCHTYEWVHVSLYMCHTYERVDMTTMDADVLQDQLICSSHVTHTNKLMSHIWMNGCHTYEWVDVTLVNESMCHHIYVTLMKESTWHTWMSMFCKTSWSPPVLSRIWMRWLSYIWMN